MKERDVFYLLIHFLNACIGSEHMDVISPDTWAIFCYFSRSISMVLDLKVEQLGLELRLIWDATTAGVDLTQCAIMLASTLLSMLPLMKFQEILLHLVFLLPIIFYCFLF